ncbi:uncharacterized protein LOC143859334 [Tasmannia lanceolata]|uniref:uncharacterized protein LOC143859334 n=1 Tax=Tasmannia lanceolata TaxID=3420 RepID=UPI004064677C
MSSTSSETDSSSKESGSTSTTTGSGASERAVPASPMEAGVEDEEIVIVLDEESGEEMSVDLDTIPVCGDGPDRVETSDDEEDVETAVPRSPRMPVEVIAEAQMEANPQYNIGALYEVSHLWPGKLQTVRDKYCIPSRYILRAAVEGDRASNDSADLCLYEEALRAGLRLPFHPFFADVLNYYGLAVTQVVPNSWRTLVGFLYLLEVRLRRNPTVPVFRMCAHLKRHKDGGWIYISQRPEVRMITGIPTSIHTWKNRFFYVKDTVPGSHWPFSLQWRTPDTRRLSKKPALEDYDHMTFALIKEELKRGQIHCSEFEEEAELVALGVSRATPAQMVKQMSLLDRIKQTSQASPAQEQPQAKGKKRKVPESTPPMVALAKPLKSSRATHKLALSSRADTTGQSSKSGGTTPPRRGGAVLGIAAATTVGGDNVFRPNWAVQKTDTGLGDTRVATELMYKGVLPRDRLEVEKEVPETCEAAISSALYQLQVYSRDMAKKRYLFSETITRIESEKAQLQKENGELTEAVQIKEAELNSLQDELQRVKNQAVQDLLSSAERARKKEKAAVEKAVKETEERKEAQHFDLGLQAYRAGFLLCSEQVKRLHPGVSLDGLTVPYAPPEGEDEEEEDEPDSSRPVEADAEVTVAAVSSAEVGELATLTPTEVVTEGVADEEA